MPVWRTATDDLKSRDRVSLVTSRAEGPGPYTLASANDVRRLGSTIISSFRPVLLVSSAECRKLKEHTLD